MTSIKLIKEFVGNKNIAVAGTSTNKKKFGYIVFKNLLKNKFNVYPVNPKITEIDGIACYPDIGSLPAEVKALVFVTSPDVTDKITTLICGNGQIEYLWFQQGSADNSTIDKATSSGKKVVHGECILMYLSPSGFPHSLHRFFKKLFGRYPK